MYSLDNSFSLGGGVAYDGIFNNEAVGYLFAKAEYAFRKENHNLAPIVGLKRGISYGEHGDNVVGFVVKPEVGLAYKRFALLIGALYDTESRESCKVNPSVLLRYSLAF